MQTFYLIVSSLALGIAGALAYRARGMNENSVPRIIRHRWTRRMLVAAIIWLGASGAGAGIWSLLAGAVALPGIIVGHGSYADLGTVEREDNEWFRNPLDWIFGKEPPYLWYRDAVGLALTGLVVTVPISLIPGVGLWYGAVGCLKAVAYFIGWRLPRSWGYEPTAIGELLWGFFMVSALVLA